VFTRNNRNHKKLQHHPAIREETIDDPKELAELFRTYLREHFRATDLEVDRDEMSQTKTSSQTKICSLH
jgi:hypothetical protein